jgi:hypothetical protein
MVIKRRKVLVLIVAGSSPILGSLISKRGTNGGVTDTEVLVENLSSLAVENWPLEVRWQQDYNTVGFNIMYAGSWLISFVIYNVLV